MSLGYLVGTLLVVAVLLWALNQYVPMDSKIKAIINAVVVICVVVWVLQAFGVFHRAGAIPVPQVGGSK